MDSLLLPETLTFLEATIGEIQVQSSVVAPQDPSDLSGGLVHQVLAYLLCQIHSGNDTFSSE